MKDNKTKKHSKRVREREGEIDNKEIRKIIRKYNKLLIFFLFIIIINFCEKLCRLKIREKMSWWEGEI